MKKQECQQTRKKLDRYLHGHVFATERARIGKHLSQCVICRSEFEALKRTEETRQILKDIHASDGVVGRVQDGVSALAKVKKVLYRPLWIAGIVLAAGAVYYYAMKPRQLDIEIENIVKSGPATSPSATVASATPPAPEPPAAKPATPAPANNVRPQTPPPAPAPIPEPLVVTLKPENDTTAVRRINEVLRGHGQLRTLKFSETVKEVAGSLTAKELLTFFDRIGSAASVSYSRKRMESFPATQPIPFVLKLKAAPKVPAVSAAEPAAAKPEPASAENRVPSAASSAPTVSAVP